MFCSNSRFDAHRPGFTMLEFLTACAALLVIMGLITSLARYVRANAALSTLRQQLTELNLKLQAAGLPPGMETFAPGVTAEHEAAVPAAVRSMGLQNSLVWSKHLGVDSRAYLDPWGTPIVLILSPHPIFGTAPRSKAFFVSAGPDCRYFTVADDAYGYELEPMSMTFTPQTIPTHSGHRE